MLPTLKRNQGKDLSADSLTLRADLGKGVFRIKKNIKLKVFLRKKFDGEH